MNDRIIGEDVIRKLIKYDGYCCSSCHEDEEEHDIEMSEIDLGKNRYAQVCCAVRIAFDDWLKIKVVPF